MTAHTARDEKRLSVEQAWVRTLTGHGVPEPRSRFLANLALGGPRLGRGTPSAARIRHAVGERLWELDLDGQLGTGSDPTTVREELLDALDAALAGRLVGPAGAPPSIATPDPDARPIREWPPDTERASDAENRTHSAGRLSPGGTPDPEGDPPAANGLAGLSLCGIADDAGDAGADRTDSEAGRSTGDTETESATDPPGNESGERPRQAAAAALDDVLDRDGVTIGELAAVLRRRMAADRSGLDEGGSG